MYTNKKFLHKIDFFLEDRALNPNQSFSPVAVIVNGCFNGSSLHETAFDDNHICLVKVNIMKKNFFIQSYPKTCKKDKNSAFSQFTKLK